MIFLSNDGHWCTSWIFARHRRASSTAGQPTQVALPEGVVLDFAYDPRGRLTGVTDNLGNREEYRYDAEGNRIETLTRDPDGGLAHRQAQAFDSLGRRSAVIEPGESADAVTAFSHDGAGNPVAVTAPNGHVTHSAYDPGRRLTGRTDALGGATAFAHDALGQVVAVTAPNGAATAFTHDPLGRPLTESSPDRGDLVYTHDADNRLLTRTDARGITARYSYDALDRLEHLCCEGYSLNRVSPGGLGKFSADRCSAAAAPTRALGMEQPLDTRALQGPLQLVLDAGRIG
ncbi:MAG TPA: hypothetical protein VFV18_01065 [Porticoccaceae bacterium]|nr:hypothetical protein [Porticoccaceae bacterium]